MPAFNCERYVAAAIESALSQTLPADEILVVNDGSTDSTADILARFGPPVRVIHQVNRGRSSARNAGILAAKSEFVVFLDADDLLTPTSIERRVALLRSRPEVGVVYGDMEVIDDAGTVRGTTNTFLPGPRPSGRVLAELARSCFILIPAVVRRSLLVERAFDETLHHAEDYDLWRRLAAVTEFAYDSEPVGCYRIHDANTIGLQSRQMMESEVEVQRRIFTMPEFAQLGRRVRAGAYCYHGAKSAAIGESSAARRYLGRAVMSDPFFGMAWPLFMLSAISPKLLASIIARRRQKIRGGIDQLAKEKPSRNLPQPNLNGTACLAEI
jgi:glycosyltransferase involved in cell wall biosynthesis